MEMLHDGSDMKLMPDREARPTLDEVARLARVSRATVSRVLNSSARVTPGTRRSVEEAITRLGYVPNRAARSLVTRRTDTIALVVSEPESRVFSEPFFSAIVQGISNAISDTELQLLLLLAHSEKEHSKVERYVRQGHVDGVILMSLHGDDRLPRSLHDSAIPTVLVGRPTGGAPLPFVDADNKGGARTATDYLLSSGRTKVATITGRMDMAVAIDRFNGYCEALAEPGHPLLVADGDFSESGGERAMATLLQRHPDLDAVFAASDPMAFGALRALTAASRSVPDDVAVIGFDDVAAARSTVPPLTTVRQPFDEMAEALSDLLLSQIAGNARQDGHVTCPTELIRRGSA
jgi:DNA-binding LacI/PurR family transcriptional regulator